jgi:hypothetical protein
MHDHHIVFRSQRGLDIEDNMIELSYEQHLGNNSPHMNKEVNLKLKTDLQSYYYERFPAEEYSISEIAFILRKSERYIEKHFRKVKNFARIYKREDIIRKLMGDKLY